MERAPDFGYDDEEVEIQKLLAKKGLEWEWEQKLRNPQVVITRRKTSYNCQQCGKNMNVVDYLVNPVCLSCAKKNQEEWNK